MPFRSLDVPRPHVEIQGGDEIEPVAVLSEGLAFLLDQDHDPAAHFRIEDLLPGKHHTMAVVGGRHDEHPFRVVCSSLSTSVLRMMFSRSTPRQFSIRPLGVPLPQMINRSSRASISIAGVHPSGTKRALRPCRSPVWRRLREGRGFRRRCVVWNRSWEPLFQLEGRWRSPPDRNAGCE